MRTNWKKILYLAAEEAYENEVVRTQMEDLLVGEGKDYADKKDWVQQRVEEWVLASEETE